MIVHIVDSKDQLLKQAPNASSVRIEMHIIYQNKMEYLSEMLISNSSTKAFLFSGLG